MITIKDTTTINEKIVKAWILANGESFLFPFNQEHYSKINCENGDYSNELRAGGVRILIVESIIAFDIWEMSKEVLYRMIKFMRLRHINSKITIMIETSSPIEFANFSELNTYYNINFNNKN